MNMHGTGASVSEATLHTMGGLSGEVSPAQCRWRRSSDHHGVLYSGPLVAVCCSQGRPTPLLCAHPRTSHNCNRTVCAAAAATATPRQAEVPVPSAFLHRMRLIDLFRSIDLCFSATSRRSSTLSAPRSQHAYHSLGLVATLPSGCCFLRLEDWHLG